MIYKKKNLKLLMPSFPHAPAVTEWCKEIVCLCTWEKESAAIMETHCCQHWAELSRCPRREHLYEPQPEGNCPSQQLELEFP